MGRAHHLAHSRAKQLGILLIQQIPYSGFLSRVKTFVNCLKIDFREETFADLRYPSSPHPLTRHRKASVGFFPSMDLLCWIDLVPVLPPCWQPWLSKQVQPSIVDHPDLLEQNRRPRNEQTRPSLAGMSYVGRTRMSRCLEPIPGWFLRIKLSQIATEMQNSRKFSPAKETRYTVNNTMM